MVSMLSRCARVNKAVLGVCVFSLGVLLGLWVPNHWHDHYEPVPDEPFIQQSAQWSRAHFDVTGKFKILPYVAIAEQWGPLSQPEGSICSAVQSSMDHAAWLPKFVSSWPGPVSFALFAPGREFPLALDFIEYARHCFPNIKKQVSFHVIHPTALPPPTGKRTPVSRATLQQWCSTMTPLALLNRLGLQANVVPHWRDKLQYPQNVLRNVAREHCQTYWVTTPDIDMLFPRPSGDVTPSIYQRLSSFLTSAYTSRCQRCAYVIPVYEIREHSSSIPSNKGQLLSMIKNNQSRQYHVAIFKQNQMMSDLDRWERLQGGSDEVLVAYQVDFQFYYEPVYVAKRGTPRFDERFLGYGMVRNTQAYELYLAGFSFHVLDNVFLSHWGYREQGQLPALRVNQTAHNSALFCRHYLKQLQAKYDNYQFPPKLVCNW